jgi:hypothetical protein
LNGVHGDDTACIIHRTQYQHPEPLKPEFKAKGHSNPFAKQLYDRCYNVSESVVALKVYDMAGRLIEQREVSCKLDFETTTMGDVIRVVFTT